jgi:hypothetical protein
MECGLQVGDFHANGLAFAFATLGEPGGEALSETFGSEAETGFEAPVCDREGVVKIGGVGEIAHAKLVEPLEGTGLALAADENIDVKLLGVHKEMITP